MSASAWFAVRAPDASTQAAAGRWLFPAAAAAVGRRELCVPWLWHPQVLVSPVGDVDYPEVGMRMDRALPPKRWWPCRRPARPPPRHASQPLSTCRAARGGPRVLHRLHHRAERKDGILWLHESLWQSMQVIFWGFVISSLVGVPLGILCGVYTPIARPTSRSSSSSATCLRRPSARWRWPSLGIHDGPKIAIIVIGTFFQQVLVIANTTRWSSDCSTALTSAPSAGSCSAAWCCPASLPDLYRDQRVLLGWAWTYLIVAELIGTSSASPSSSRSRRATSTSTTWRGHRR